MLNDLIYQYHPIKICIEYAFSFINISITYTIFYSYKDCKNQRVGIRREIMRPFVVTVLRWHHGYSIFYLKTFPYYRVCFLVLGKSKGEVGIFWRRLLFNHSWGSFSFLVWGRDSCIFLLLLLKFPKVENNQRFLFSVCFQNKAHNPTVNYFYT